MLLYHLSHVRTAQIVLDNFRNARAAANDKIVNLEIRSRKLYSVLGLTVDEVGHISTRMKSHGYSCDRN